MEDWQGCLGPACQTALQRACHDVTRRGGYAVTLEDFLLAMLDEIPELNRFLQRQGVDLDELTRTIQCEQPIVTEVASDQRLSSQLVYWFHSARQLTDSAWLEWPALLHGLVHGAERLRGKAYVAVLELVGHWPCKPEEPALQTPGSAGTLTPVALADARWFKLSRDVCACLSSMPNGLVWLTGAPGSGKSSWLDHLIPALPGGAVRVDIRREAEILASDEPAIPVPGDGAVLSPALVLDNLSPADLVTLMKADFSIARELVTGFPGPVMLISPDSAEAREAFTVLQRYLGRHPFRFRMVPASVEQRLAILTAHQPLIEKRWRIELARGLTEYAARSRNPLVSTPGNMLQWVEAAAARLQLFAERGPLQAEVLAGQADTLRRQYLLALARQQPSEQLEAALAELEVERAAFEVCWHERKRDGSLRLLTIGDLHQELEHRVAAVGAPGHYTHELAETRELKLA